MVTLPPKLNETHVVKAGTYRDGRGSTRGTPGPLGVVDREGEGDGGVARDGGVGAERERQCALRFRVEGLRYGPRPSILCVRLFDVSVYVYHFNSGNTPHSTRTVAFS